MMKETTDRLAIIDRLAARKPHYREALDLYRQLAARMIEVSPPTWRLSFDENMDKMKRHEGFPLFERQALPIDLGTASELLSGFMTDLSHEERPDTGGLMNALKILDKDPDWSTRLFEAILKKDHAALAAIAEDVGLDPDGLRYLALVALGPEMEALRNAVSDRIDTENWDYGYCPLCGSTPNMAYFDDSGKRYLYCELCGTEWAHQRIGCPFCGNQDHEKLGYLEPEQEEGHRVYFCRKCLKYIKTLDKRVIEDTAPMELENIVTLHLDLLAVEAGFK